ncbi:hypothetical protein Cgig2_005164 [Carnegiea gigantea]|uniref:Uncharacterized protein n=1 Tax=Carnegiea gigantea TaxID=171969 RepID=A0A9Q1KG34_9CARY|nr:hypothetical protein Cgig2_005164 [Carnegiea gigantea]
MMTKNTIRRFVRCKRFRMGGGCDHLEWIDDALCDRVRSIVVALMVRNDSLGNEIQKLQKVRQQRKVEEESVKSAEGGKKRRLKSEMKMMADLKVEVAGSQALEGMTTICFLQKKKILLESNGPHVARVSIYETNILTKNNLIGHCEIDLFQFLTQDSDSDFETIDLLDPSSSDTVVGRLSFSCFVEDPQETEKGFARRLLSIVVCSPFLFVFTLDDVDPTSLFS